MTDIGYWLLLVGVFGVLVPLGMRRLAAPFIRAYERRRAEHEQVAAGLAIAHDTERANLTPRSAPPDER